MALTELSRFLPAPGFPKNLNPNLGKDAMEN
jgi:hypothetical protein